jgi:hypothetical protein
MAQRRPQAKAGQDQVVAPGPPDLNGERSVRFRH